MQKVKKDMNSAIRKNKDRAKATTAYSELLQQQMCQFIETILDLNQTLQKERQGLQIIHVWYFLLINPNSPTNQVV